jgi:hypothetical protein
VTTQDTLNRQAESSAAAVDEWLPLPDVAERMGLPVNRVRQLLRDHKLLAERRDGVLMVPAAFLSGDQVVKGLPGLLTLLFDAGYAEDEAMRWLFTEDPSLPGTPVQALQENRGKEVHRRAQALGF